MRKQARAIILRGPSGVGKSTVAEKITKKYDFKHCDTDKFKRIFSANRSKERTEVGNMVNTYYAQKLIKRKYSIIIEALSEEYTETLIPLLQKNNYKIIRICIKAPLEQCIENHKKRAGKSFKSDVVREVYDKLIDCGGDVVDATGKTAKEVFEIIEQKCLKA